jgi:hypothetical protein
MRFLKRRGDDEWIGGIRTGKTNNPIWNATSISIFLKDGGVFLYFLSIGMFTLSSWKYGLIGFPGYFTRK